MNAPRWARWLLGRLAAPGRAADVVGDLEETHRSRVVRRGRLVATLLTTFEALDLAFALSRQRLARRRRYTSISPRDRLRPAGGGGISPLDVRLGLRMLVKYPGLALVGGLGMTVAVAIGAGFFDLTSEAFDTSMGFPGGDRVVALEIWDGEINNQARRILHDYATWREEMSTVEALGAWRTVGRNLITGDGAAAPVPVAQMTASGFRLTAVPPVLGRHLVEADERPSAPPVVVIGHEAWRSRFHGDVGIVGATVRLGETPHTVVGVMPEGYGFPVYHQYWTPLRADPDAYERGAGPDIFVFGRLAPGATIEQARAELSTLVRRATADFPETHALYSARVLPHTLQFLEDFEGTELPLLQLPVLLLLLVICVNVAILVYARTATRHGEIAVRTALGASRSRIVLQLLVEALILSALAAALGLAIAGAVLGRIRTILDAMTFIPFWMEFRLSAGTVVYAAGLALLAAVIVGVVPGLKATGRRVQASLRELHGGTGMRMGKTWTALIVVQVAIAVAILPPAFLYASEFVRYGFAEMGFAADEYLTARLTMERDEASGLGSDAADLEGEDTGFAARYGAALRELGQRLDEEATLAGATFSARPPGDEIPLRIEVEDVLSPAEGGRGHRVLVNHVDPGFFRVLALPLLSGRTFGGDDAEEGTAVVVNEAFVQEILGGANAIGRRIRYVEGYRSGGVARAPQGDALEEWYEIVGVVGDLLESPLEPNSTVTRLYRPMALGQVHPVSLSMRVSGAPAAFAPRLLELGAAVDPRLQPRAIFPLDRVLDEVKAALRMGALGIVAVTLSVLLLSAAGVHAMMSFTVSRRRREIGIRAALGARPSRLLTSVFSRALLQLGAGAAVGLGIAAVMNAGSGDEILAGQGALLFPSVALFMVLVGLFAAWAPARRGLRIEPTEALREE